ncbi:uncharacterized protein L969DRAFT_95882 [Mixia osmundae IAM 14324]|uniref:Uncharacterized protein n=1 Tax=Mixia osmundae (strain CBS 9802 / IAM 14324 / JCM 22182 / KY 12970) TaxID=764103 RepID=G7DWP1_MIXOS|nr:uncharacterized protein L969DRAFT_95882 [Mixia osmundae IAM 14324]KEI38041.1 hypothetical protein L969DRAFT_95882 [Mixia osmundae IAM 14324]GAA95153.1 hypothetical protein E5Q_01808 [Mixia osmundae IAM 14324]
MWCVGMLLALFASQLQSSTFDRWADEVPGSADSHEIKAYSQTLSLETLQVIGQERKEESGSTPYLICAVLASPHSADRSKTADRRRRAARPNTLRSRPSRDIAILFCLQHPQQNWWSLGFWPLAQTAPKTVAIGHCLSGPSSRAPPPVHSLTVLLMTN